MKATGKFIDGFTEFEVEDIPFNGVKFIYEDIKFADKENDDGSLTMTFSYHVTEVPNGIEVIGNVQFEKVIGDYLLHLLDEQVSKLEVIFKGGTDE